VIPRIVDGYQTLCFILKEEEKEKEEGEAKE
jgi:hypothetical protein